MGVDHLVDDDLARRMAEIEACQPGHELTLPNTFQTIPGPPTGV